MRNVCIKAVHIAMVHTNYVEKEVLAGRGASLILSLSHVLLLCMSLTFPPGL